MNIRRWALVVLFAILAGLFEATFVTFLPSPWGRLRPIFEIAVLFLVINRPRDAFIFVAIAGMVMDIFPVGGSGFAVGRFLCVMAVLTIISQTVLTNRSVYATAILMLLARILDVLWLGLAAVFSQVVSTRGPAIPSFMAVLQTLGWDIGLVSISFVFISLFTRRFLMTASHGRYDDV